MVEAGRGALRACFGRRLYEFELSSMDVNKVAVAAVLSGGKDSVACSCCTLLKAIFGKRAFQELDI